MLKRFCPLGPYLGRYKARYMGGLLCLLIAQTASVCLPLIIKSGIDDLRYDRTLGRVPMIVGLFLTVSLVKAVFQFWTRWILLSVSRDVEYDLRNDLFRHLMCLSARYYTEHRTGDLMSRLTNDLNIVRNMIGVAVIHSAIALVVGITSVSLMVHLDWRLTLMVLVPMPFVAVAVKILGVWIHDGFERIQALNSEITERVRENLCGLRVVRAFSQENAEIAAFNVMNGDFVEKSKRLIWITSLLWPVIALMYALALMLLLVMGGRHVLNGFITVGTFAALNVYLAYLFWPIIALGGATNLVQRGVASLNRLKAIFEAQPEIDPVLPEKALTTLRGEIEFRGLSFSYNGHPVLKGINLHIPAGTTVAVVGATGSGKSTFVSLIPRLYDAPPGTLLIDGVPIHEISLRTLREQIGFVPQETVLFNATIRDNIKMGAPDATDGQVQFATEISNIFMEIRDLPKRFDTMVGERGLALSGGQKQRIAISRAVIRDPRILILDDALSSVDTYTEDAILRRLTGAVAARTTILVSHRVSTVQNADEIVVLKDGEIAERGSHLKLLLLDGYYAELYKKQLIEEELEREV